MSTGNASKMDSKNDKKQHKKTNMALLMVAALGGVAVLGYVVWSYRATLAAGGASAARTLGPIISRVMPAIVVGILSMVVGPEGAILGVPLGAFFGPELLGLLGGLLGEGSAAQIGAGVARIQAAQAAQAVAGTGAS